jgi:hypothetical protein
MNRRVKRRHLLIAAAALFVTTATAWITWLFARVPKKKPPQTVAASSLDSGSLRLAVADAIVPRDEEWPAASEGDFLPGLELFVASSAHRRRNHEKYWPLFEAEIRRTVPIVDGRPDPKRLRERLEYLHVQYRSGHRSAVAAFFEQLRRDVLRIYYSSPEGWARVGYAGPVQRAHPREPGPP